MQNYPYMEYLVGDDVPALYFHLSITKNCIGIEITTAEKQERASSTTRNQCNCKCCSLINLRSAKG